MANRPRLLLLDANAVFAAFRHDAWAGLCAAYEVVVPTTVIHTEALFYVARDTGRRVELDLAAEARAGTIVEVSVPAGEVARLRARFDAGFRRQLDAGEAEGAGVSHQPRRRRDALRDLGRIGARGGSDAGNRGTGDVPGGSAAALWTRPSSTAPARPCVLPHAHRGGAAALRHRGGADALGLGRCKAVSQAGGVTSASSGGGTSVRAFGGRMRSHARATMGVSARVAAMRRGWVIFVAT